MTTTKKQFNYKMGKGWNRPFTKEEIKMANEAQEKMFGIISH